MIELAGSGNLSVIAIDDPLDASKQRLAEEERTGSSVSPLVPKVSEFIEIIP
jgi:hypothetical protein